MKTYREIYHDRIDKVKTTEEMKQAYQDMLADELAIEKDPDLKEPVTMPAEERVNQNLGYILGHYGPKTHELWYGNLPNVSHPVFGKDFGRGYYPSAEKAFIMGQDIMLKLHKIVKAVKKSDEVV